MLPFHLFFKRGAGRSLDYNREHGRFQVVYPDGMKSQRFCWDVAKTYRSLFGGKIVKAERKG